MLLNRNTYYDNFDNITRLAKLYSCIIKVDYILNHIFYSTSFEILFKSILMKAVDLERNELMNSKNISDIHTCAQHVSTVND